jgi:hypothetical protein
MSSPSDPRLFHPHVARNREPILAVLQRVLPRQGEVLEIASGSGEHAVFFAGALPSLSWQPSDMDPAALASIAAFCDAAKLPNLRAPIYLDVTQTPWPIASAAAVVCCNMIHISPWAVTEGLVAGAGAILPEGGVLYLYGPYTVDGVHTASTNETFDGWLRAQNPAWGIRDLGVVMELAARHGLICQQRVPMPANNFSVIFRR